MSHTVDIPKEIKDALRNTTAALVIKCNKQKLVMQVDEEFDDVTIEQLAEELPENSPRYVLVSYELKHKDGRASSPLILINWAPTSSEIGLLTLHASALIEFQELAGVSKVIEIRDGPEGLTKEVIDAKLLG